MDVGAVNAGAWKTLGVLAGASTSVDGSSDQLAGDDSMAKAEDAAVAGAKQREANAKADVNGGRLTDEQGAQEAAALRASVSAKATQYDNLGQAIDPILTGAANGYVALVSDPNATAEDTTQGIGGIADSLGTDAKANAAKIDDLQKQGNSLVDRMRAASPAEQTQLAQQWSKVNASMQALMKTLDREMQLQALMRQLMFDNPSPATIAALKKLGLGKMVDTIIQAYVAAARKKHGAVPPAAALNLTAAGYGGLVSADVASYESARDKQRLDPRHWQVLSDGQIVPFVPPEDLDTKLVAQGKSKVDVPRMAGADGARAGATALETK